MSSLHRHVRADSLRGPRAHAWLASPARAVAGDGPHAARGFTLIEILIAVLVLALGLLGLGAVFPVVVRQQRQSSDVVLGITALRSAESYILSHGRGMVRATGDSGEGWLNEKSLTPAPWRLAGAQQTSQACGFDFWLAKSTAGFGPGEETRRGWSLPVYQWMPQQIRAAKYGGGAVNIDVGAIHVGWPDDFAFGSPLKAREIRIPMAQRLFPLPDSAPGVEPQFVWDFVGRRVTQGGWASQAVQLAIFVRRIDPGIRVPRGRTLSDVLLNRYLSGLSGAQARVAVGANYTPSVSDPEKASQQQRPTLDGTGNYSPIMTVPFTFTGPNRITIQVGSDAQLDPARQAIRQIGQKLVDNRGNIYTVVKLEEKLTEADRNDSVFIDARVSSAEIDQSTKKIGGELPFNVALTPQIPAAVSVLTIPR